MSWQRTTLGEVATIVMGQSPLGSTYNEVGQGLPFYQGVKDFGSRYPTKRVYCTAPTRIAEEGDILFSVRAPIGSINRANEKCSIGRGLSVVRAHNGDDFDFIECLLKSMNRAWGAYESQGAIFGNARRRDLEDLQIAWPPHSIRVQIASILSAYDDLIENNRRRGCSTGSGSFTSTFPVTNTSPSPTACRRGGRRRSSVRLRTSRWGKVPSQFTTTKAVTGSHFIKA